MVCPSRLMPRLGIIAGGMGHAGLVAEAMEQPLFLPQDMAAYRSFNHPELFLSLKRDLAMVSDSAYFFFIYIYLHFIAEVSFYHYY